MNLGPSWERGGEFATFEQWVNKAPSWIGSIDAMCLDTKGRWCRWGEDFQRARDEGAFPVTFYFRVKAGPST